MEKIIQDTIKKSPKIFVQIVTDPKRFFASMPKSGGYTEPLVYTILISLLTAALFTIFEHFTLSALSPLRGLYGVPPAGISYAPFIFIPIQIIAGTFINAAILYVIWLWMGSKESYETAYRSLAYIGSVTVLTMVLSLIPVLGWIVALAYTVWLVVLASEQVHGIPKNLAIKVFGILGIIFFFIFFVQQVQVFAPHQLTPGVIPPPKGFSLHTEYPLPHAYNTISWRLP